MLNNSNSQNGSPNRDNGENPQSEAETLAGVIVISKLQQFFRDSNRYNAISLGVNDDDAEMIRLIDSIDEGNELFRNIIVYPNSCEVDKYRTTGIQHGFQRRLNALLQGLPSEHVFLPPSKPTIRKSKKWRIRKSEKWKMGNRSQKKRRNKQHKKHSRGYRKRIKH